MTDSDGKVEHLSMRQFLRNLEGVLGELAGLAEDIDATVGELVMSGRGQSQPDLQTLQKVDLLFQSLTAMRTVAGNARDLSGESNGLHPAHLVEGVLLEAIRRKCTQMADTVEAAAPAEDLLF